MSCYAQQCVECGVGIKESIISLNVKETDKFVRNFGANMESLCKVLLIFVYLYIRYIIILYIYSVTCYTLTHSMEQSPSSEANRCKVMHLHVQCKISSSYILCAYSFD